MGQREADGMVSEHSVLTVSHMHTAQVHCLCPFSFQWVIII